MASPACLPPVPLLALDTGSGSHSSTPFLPTIGCVTDEDLIGTLRREIDRLAAENDELRARYRVGPPAAEGISAPEEGRRGIAVFLTPDPAEEPRPKGLGPQAVANLAQTLVQIMGGRRPDLEWRAEHDLERIPETAVCFQLGEAAVRLMSNGSSPPKTFRVERKEDGEPCLRRCLIDGEPDSDRFRAGFDRLSREFDEIAAEGEAAIGAGAGHHAGWALRALDVVVAEMNLALARFEGGCEDWREGLERPRVEYEPRYRVDAEAPVGC